MGMLRHERLSVVLDLIAQRGTITVGDLVESCGISAATARRDLDELASQQLIQRTRGGAVAHAVTYDLPLRYKSSRQPQHKRRIAEAAAQLVEPGSVIGLNGGTTTTEVAREIATVIDSSDDRGTDAHNSVTIVTNALNIANELAVRPKVKVVVVGGVLRPQSFEVIGPFARHVLNSVSIHTTFLGVDALDTRLGPSARHEGEAQINQAMVEHSERVVVVADSTKLGERAFCRICSLDQVDILITDDGADPELAAAFTEQGIDVRLV